MESLGFTFAAQQDGFPKHAASIDLTGHGFRNTPIKNDPALQNVRIEGRQGLIGSIAAGGGNPPAAGGGSSFRSTAPHPPWCAAGYLASFAASRELPSAGA